MNTNYSNSTSSKKPHTSSPSKPKTMSLYTVSLTKSGNSAPDFRTKRRTLFSGRKPSNYNLKTCSKAKTGTTSPKNSKLYSTAIINETNEASIYFKVDSELSLLY